MRHMSPVMCHLSRVTCHMSHVIFLYYYLTNNTKKNTLSFFKKWIKWWSWSVEGLLSTGTAISNRLGVAAL